MQKLAGECFGKSLLLALSSSHTHLSPCPAGWAPRRVGQQLQPKEVQLCALCHPWLVGSISLNSYRASTVRGFTVCLEGYNCFKKTHPPNQKNTHKKQNKTPSKSKKRGTKSERENKDEPYTALSLTMSLWLRAAFRPGDWGCCSAPMCFAKFA